jgi:hypothetical protein
MRPDVRIAVTVMLVAACGLSTGPASEDAQDLELSAGEEGDHLQALRRADGEVGADQEAGGDQQVSEGAHHPPPARTMKME